MRTVLRGDNHADTRERNLRMVLRSLSQYGPLSRRQISELSGLAPGTITGLVADLVEREVLVSAGVERAPGSRGGPARTLLDFNVSGAAVIGVAIGVFGRAVTLCGPRGEVLAHRYSLDYSLKTTFQEQVDWIARSALEVVSERGLARSAILGIGVGAEGRVDSTSGEGEMVPHGAIDPFPVARQLEEKTGFPVVIASAVHADAAGEIWFGAGAGIGQLLCVSVGTTIGVAAAIRGEVIRGFNDLGGDFSHVVVEPDGDMCVCGKRGCLEAVAGVQTLRTRGQAEVRSGRPSLISDLSGGDLTRVTAELVAEAAGNGDAAASEIVERAATYIARAMAPVVATLSPEAIILLGEVPRRSGVVMIGAIASGVAASGLSPSNDPPRVLTSRVDVPPGTALGAAALALDRFFFTPQLAQRGSREDRAVTAETM